MTEDRKKNETHTTITRRGFVRPVPSVKGIYSEGEYYHDAIGNLASYNP